MAVNRVGRHAGSRSYIEGSSRNHENEGEIHNVRWMMYSVNAVLGGLLYSVYAVLGVN